jgi:phage-related protein
VAQIFTWIPSTGFTKESQPEVTTTKFGSGYSQRIRYGINTITSSWSLSFVNQSVPVANAIIAFLELHGGAEYFLFQPPGESTYYKIICSTWNLEYTSHISRTVTATFTRVYDI